MKISLAFSVLLLTPLGACAAQADPTAEAKDAVRLLLTDPDSATFEFVNSKDGIVCGLVNSKNALGGYVGEQGFMVEERQALLDSGQPNFGTAFATKCPVETSVRYHQIQAARIHQKVDELKGQLNAQN